MTRERGGPPDERRRAQNAVGTPRAGLVRMLGSNRGVWPAWLIMFVLSLLLGWLPFIGPAIAGWVGGMQAGTVSAALTAAVIPALILTAFLWLIGVMLNFALVATLLGIGVFMVLVIGALPLLVGAWIGGAMAASRERGSVR